MLNKLTFSDGDTSLVSFVKACSRAHPKAPNITCLALRATFVALFLVIGLEFRVEGSEIALGKGVYGWKALGIPDTEGLAWEAAGYSASVFDDTLYKMRVSPINGWQDLTDADVSGSPYKLFGKMLRVKWSCSMTLGDENHDIQTTLGDPARPAPLVSKGRAIHLLHVRNYCKPGPVISFAYLEEVRITKAADGSIQSFPVFRVVGNQWEASPPSEEVVVPAARMIEGSEKPIWQWRFIDSKGLEFEKYVIRSFEPRWPPLEIKGWLVWPKATHPGIAPIDALHSMTPSNCIYIQNDENSFLVGLYDDLMIVDTGCCPGTRGLTLYRLPQGNTVWTDTYDGQLAIGQGGALTYWECSGYRKVGARSKRFHNRVERLLSKLEWVSVDLKSLEVNHSGKRKEVEDQPIEETEPLKDE